MAQRLGAARVEVDRLRFDARDNLLADAPAADRARLAMRASSPDCAVAVGAGTFNDLTRFATLAEGCPYVSVPTAASMEGPPRHAQYMIYLVAQRP